MRLLVVEDDREAATYLARPCARPATSPIMSPDGERRLRAARATGEYDVLVVDRMLPKLDGLSLIADAAQTQAIETPVLILSALGQVDDRVTGLRAGGDDYLAKALRFFRTARPRRGARPAQWRRRAADDGL